ncbi:MAG: hypothetical protein IT371_18310 [Deltaproteobacteria bacterium]|nr:hypothetical protein [Deltaproteobacteria bacterium]
MKRLLVGLLLAVGAAQVAHASPGGLFGAPEGPKRWAPVRWGAPAAPERGPGAGELARQSPPTRPVPAAPRPGSCRHDDHCGKGQYCDEGRCAAIEHPVNILYLYYRSGNRRFEQLLGFYWHQKGADGFRVVFPLYWSFFTPERTTRVVFPLYYEVSWPKENIVTVVVPPVQVRRTPDEKNFRIWPIFFWTNYGARGAGLTIWPLFHYSRVAEKRTAILPPLLSGYQTDPSRDLWRALFLGLVYYRREGAGRSHAVLPFFYRRRDGERSFTWSVPFNFYWRRGARGGAISFPLFWQVRSPERSLTVAGPFFHRRRGSVRYGALLPLAYYHVGPTTRTTVAFPLFIHRSREGGRRSQVISPLFWSERDDEARVRQWGLLVPPYFHRRDSDREVNWLFPLVLRWHTKADRVTTWVIPPLILRGDPEGASQVFFPLFWRFAERQRGAVATTSVFFPLWYRRKNLDGSHFNLLFPFFYKRRPDGFSTGLFPLLFAGGGGGRRHAVVFPVFWHVKNARASTTVLGPAYYRSHAAGGYATGLLPLLYAGSREGRSYQVLFPLFWHLKSRPEGYDTTVLGPFFYGSSRKGRVVGLLPLFAAGSWKGTRFATVLPPVFYHASNARDGRSTTLAGLYYASRDRERAGQTLFPIFYRRQRFAKEGTTTSTTLLPLFHYRTGPAGQLLVTPAGGFRRSADGTRHEGLVGPVAWHRGPRTRGFAIVPLFLHYRRPAEQATTTILLPIGVRHVSPELKAYVWFPLFWRFVEPKERSLVLFPVYWRMRQEQGVHADVLFPLFWRWHSPRRRLEVAGPWFRHRTATTHTSGLFPLALYRRNEERSYLGAAPLFYYEHRFREQERSVIWGPLYFKTYREGYATGLFPLFFHKRTPERRYTVITPLIWHFASPQAQTSTTFLGPFFYRRKANARAFGLLPLLYTGTDGAGDRTTALFPLFYHRKELARRALYTPLFGVDRSPERKRFYAAIYWHERGEKRDLDLFFPLALRLRNHDAQATSVFAFPLYFGRWSPARSFHLLFPVVWRWRGIDTSATVVFPFIWDVHDRHQARTTVVFPFVMRRRDHEERSTAYLTPPGIWVKSHREGTDAVVFPIFWHFGGKERSSTVGFPLYWDFKRPGHRTTIAAPFFWRFDRPSTRTYVVLNSYYKRDKEKDTYTFHLIPFFHVERKRPGDVHWEVLTGLFGYERIGRRRFVTVFFFFNIELSPLPAPAPAAAPPPPPRRSVARSTGRAPAWDL